MSKYNGWTNYATWRVNLEIFDGLPLEHLAVHPETWLEMESYDRVQVLKQHVEEAMDVYPDGFVKDYAEAFLANVNWYEIADNLAELTA
jgi:hypothetical protein